MPLLSISVNNEPNKRASVFFKQGGVVLTDIFGGNRTWWQIKDAALLKRISNLRGSKDAAAVLADNIWEEISKMDPNKIATVYQAVGTRPSTGMPVFEGGFKNQAKSSGHEVPGEQPAPKVNLRALTKRWFDFFSEFHFKPQPRFMNSVARCGSLEGIRGYVVGYFELTNNSFAADVAEKVKSREFEALAADTLLAKTDKQINKRLEVYYGEPGGGKTTTAICNNPDAEVVLCHASMTPDELFRGFDFEDGKPVFKGCALRRAMEEGKTIILDEINLLNEDCRRALQGIADAKAEVTINTEKIAIKDGFKIVGTMNLNVGDMVFPLPEPLVDRCAVIKRFEMDPDMVAALAF